MYRSVVSQQGRVTLEADANEAEELRAADERAQLLDVIGPSGSSDDGFLISVPAPGGANADFAIGQGTLYVGGVRLQSTPRAGSYLAQRQNEWTDYPERYAGPEASEPAGNPQGLVELVYLEVTEQEVSAVEDPALREVALGGPDTTARTRMLQRVARVQVSANACPGALPEALSSLGFGTEAPAEDKPAYLDEKSMRLVSTMRLQASFTAPDAANDPCQPLAQAGFLGAENQLIRVQVTRETAKFVWGYDNASFIYRASLDPQAPNAVTLDAAPVDVFHHPRLGQWVELLTTAVELDSSARIAAPHGLLVQIDGYDPSTRVITLKGNNPLAALLAAPPRQLFVRIWENQQDFATDDAAVALVKADDVSTGVSVSTSAGPRMPGDYWMIGVRPNMPQAISELNALQPQTIYPARLMAAPQPPDGPARWLVPLAVVSWTSGTTAQVTDCRNKFHNLITPDECDLEFHNQHLHGWGVVCGLQVACMPTSYAEAHDVERPREAVIVNNGYAIHPTGSDIRLRAASGEGFTAVALGQMAVDANALTRDAQGVIENGSVSLWIDKDGALRVDAFDPKQQKPLFEELFEGTLLFDIYNDCVLKVVEYVKTQLIAPANSEPDNEASRRLISLINLFAQLGNQTSGSHIFLSGPGANTEHAYLREFFEGLKDLLESKTFCAMFDDIAYPEHDIFRDDRTPSTIFGTGHHSELRVHPRFPIAVTFGGDKIHVYHLGEHRFLRVVPFPVADVDIQDVAFSPTDDDFYVAAWTSAGSTDSTFINGTITEDGAITFAPIGVDCPGLKLCRLAPHPKGDRVVFATARGQGLYQFKLGSGSPPLLLEAFRASGHLALGRIPDTIALYAGEHASDPNPTEFTQVRGFVLDAIGLHVVEELYFAFGQDALLTGSGHDDLTVMPAKSGDTDDLYAIVDGQSDHKVLLCWDPADGSRDQPGSQPQNPVIDLGESEACRIAYSADSRWALVTYGDASVGRVYQPEQRLLETELLHPLQIGPSSVGTDKNGVFYVLEYGSSTITAIPPAADGQSAVDLTELANYRYAAITAFLKTIGRVVQYLKDCVCQHLLVNCPTGDGKVYLADISFKDGKVYQICNFHHRKYVHTFPTVEYWLSIVPVIPLIKTAVEKLCCSVVGGFFDELAPPPATQAEKAKPDKLSPMKVRYGLTYLKDANVSQQVALRAKQLFAGYSTGKRSLQERLRKPSPGNVEKVADTSALLDTTAEAATERARADGLEVRRVEVVSDSSTALLRTMRAAPPPRGAAIDLLTNTRGRVVGWRPSVDPPPPLTAQPAVPHPAAPQPAVPQPAAGEIAALRRDLAAISEAHAQQKAALDHTQAELARMREQVATMAAALDRLHR